MKVTSYISSISRPGSSAERLRLADKYIRLLDRVYFYRSHGRFDRSIGCGKAAEIVRARLVDMDSQRLAA